jgi:lipopolysaccharide/colanic/teichoic acid biosynthesis glycosyltransferase
LFLPLLLGIAAAIKINDRGPVIYRQRRVGRDGDTFTMFKFRTMVTDADKVRKDLEAANEAAGPLFKMRKDPRITRVGSLLRRYSLDELPQLFNVLSGKMSMVGPRPPLLEETKTYAADARRRLLVKPGLTGLWQVSGRSDLTWAESIRLDLRYVEDWSLALDMVILWKTMRAVVGGAGAY